MYRKINKSFLILLLFFASSISLNAAAPKARPKYITAAILIDLPYFLKDFLHREALDWDKNQASKIGQSFIDRRTLLEQAALHLTLVNFEFDSQGLDEKQKKEFMEELGKILKQSIDIFMPMAFTTNAFMKFAKRSVNDLLAGKYKPQWFLIFEKFELLQGKKRSEGHKPPHYLVAALSQDETLTNLRLNIIQIVTTKYPHAKVSEKEFIPHVSIARISPAVAKEDILLPGKPSLPSPLIIEPKSLKINVEERGGGEIPGGAGFKPATEIKKEEARKETYWVPYQKVVELMANGKIGEAYNAILTEGLDVTLLSPGQGKTLYDIAKDLEKRKLDKKITGSPEWRNLMELLQQR